jgi:hypothetical protein
VRKLSHLREEIAQRQLFSISQFSQKLSFKKKKLKKLGMEECPRRSEKNFRDGF